MKIGEDCDIVLVYLLFFIYNNRMKSYEEKNKNKAPEILNLRKYINHILNNMPEQNFDCLYPSKRIRKKKMN